MALPCGFAFRLAHIIAKLYGKGSASIDSLFRYEDYIRNFSRQGDNCRDWQVIRDLGLQLGGVVKL